MVRNTFICEQYHRTAIVLGLFIIGLIVFLSTSITLSSDRYLERFVEHNTQVTISYVDNLTENAAIRVSSWTTYPNTKANFRAGNVDELDRIFSQRLETIGFPDAHVLLLEPGYDDYWYQGKVIPDELLTDCRKGFIHGRCFHWMDNELWFVTSAQVEAYTVLLTVPISPDSFVGVPLSHKGNLLKTTSISRESFSEGRDLFHWKRLVFSVPIGDEDGAYLTYTFHMNTLSEYFYWGYGITTLSILIFFFWIMRYKLKAIVVKADGQIESFEDAIKEIADGNYGRKFNETGYQEFDRLGIAVNNLTDTIEERNRELQDRVQELYGLLVQVLEQKDPYTRGHSERVAKYAKGIAHVLGLDNTEEIHAAGLLHDIGKISVEEALLNKPGRYTDHEYDLVKEHAQKGYDLLLESKVFHKISSWVLNHHERIDGSGYPNGLKGDEIPFEAGIIAVADVFDAMTSDRSYRDALSVEETLNHLHEGQGSIYEKDIVEALETYIKTSS